MAGAEGLEPSTKVLETHMSILYLVCGILVKTQYIVGCSDTSNLDIFVKRLCTILCARFLQLIFIFLRVLYTINIEVWLDDTTRGGYLSRLRRKTEIL